MKNNNLILNKVEEKIINIRAQKVILDKDVAVLYGVETKRINEAVKNNPEKFPKGYFFQLTKEEFSMLQSKFSTTNYQMIRTFPKAFTEKGLYMLATVLKSECATQATLSIIETFAEIKELSQTLNAIADTDNTIQQQSLIQKSTQLLSNLLNDDMQITDIETTIELNFAVMKLKHTIKRKKD